MTDSEKTTEVRHRNVGSESQSKNGGPPLMNKGPPAAGGLPELVFGRNEQQRAHMDDVEQGHDSSRDEEPLLQGDDEIINEEPPQELKHKQSQQLQPPQQNRQSQDWSWKDIAVVWTLACVPYLKAKTTGQKIRNYFVMGMCLLCAVFFLVRMIFFPKQTAAQIIDALFTKISEKISFSGASPVAIDVHLEVPDINNEN